MPNRIIFVQKFKEAEVEVTVEQEAGLSQSGRAMLRVVEILLSLKVTRCHSNFILLSRTSVPIVIPS